MPTKSRTQKGGFNAHTSTPKPTKGGGKRKSKKAKKAKHPMKADEAYCVKCEKPMKRVTEKKDTMKNGRNFLRATDEHGHKMVRIVSKA